MRQSVQIFLRASAAAALAVFMIAGSGCNSQSRAKGAQSPPPPSLSSPVRVESSYAQNAPNSRRAETVPDSEYAFLKDRQVGSSKPLPAVQAPVLRTKPAVEAPKNVLASTQTPSAQSQPAPKNEPASVYVMKKGDTLYGVARKFNLPPKELIAANTFKNPNRLPVGTKVVLPQKE